MTPRVPPPSVYTRRNLELRAAEYYACIRKLESEWKTIEDLQPQLSEIGHCCLAGDYDAAAKVLHTISMNYLFKWGHYVQLKQLWERLLGHVQNGQLHVHNLGGLGNVYFALGDDNKALQFHQAALAFARQIGFRKGVSVQLGRLGIIHRSRFEIEQARLYHEESLQIARDIGDRAIEGFRLGDLGAISLLLGQYEHALELYEQSVMIAREVRSPWEEGIRLGGIGRVYHALGYEERAQDYYQQVLLIAEAVGDRQRKSEYLRELAHSFVGYGQLETAETLCREGLSIAREIGHRWGEAHCLLELGGICLMNGNFVEAEQYCAESRSLDMIGIKHQATLLLGIAQLYRHNHCAVTTFAESVGYCQMVLEKNQNLPTVCFILATALVGQAVCNPRWIDPSQRDALLAPALTEYRRALALTAAPGVVRDALRDLELIRAAGIEGLEPVFSQLQGVLNE